MPLVTEISVSEHRTTEAACNPIFPRRWSPRSMSGKPIGGDQLRRLLEAARWAPSSFNTQPWRFIYAHRDTDAWPALFDVLVEANQAWCKNAGVLMLLAGRKRFERGEKDDITFQVSCGAAMQNLLLQASIDGLVGHAMAGFSVDKARSTYDLPEAFEPMCMIAVGQPGEPAHLPENLREGEVPSGRKPIAEIAAEGKMPL